MPENIERHNVRMNSSRRQLFGYTNVIDLRDVLKIPSDLTEAVYKCRIIYQEAIQRVEFLPYIPRSVLTLRLVQDDDIEYEHKYLDKSRIEGLREGSGTDDILIVKQSRITDASFANIVFFDGTSWITPAQPLLRGTKRQLLLDTRKIHEENITVHDLKHLQKAALINAMLDLDERVFIDMKNIFTLDKAVL
ncbi:MAG: aminotransferase class IV [Bacteroidota bacterium]|jgi:4-amino-4-deoxychorismate lyase